MSELANQNSAINPLELSRQYLDGLKMCIDTLSLEQIAEVIGYIEAAYQENRQILIMGNGGSAATASHMACDLGKNILPKQTAKSHPRCRVIALTDNVPWITALANDLRYEYIFSEQLRNLVREGDLVIAISGSGNSPNILEGVRTAKTLRAKVVGILGFNGGQVREMVDHYVIVNSSSYGYIEDIHMVLVHIITNYLATLLSQR
jgi:D-sedoheptulose 7-phosphate isomerase